jgi:hypothetical protein
MGYYKVTFLKLRPYIVHNISSYLRDPTFEASFQTATSSLVYRLGWNRVD